MSHPGHRNKDCQVIGCSKCRSDTKFKEDMARAGESIKKMIYVDADEADIIAKALVLYSIDKNERKELETIGRLHFAMIRHAEKLRK